MQWSLCVGNVKGTAVRIHFTFLIFFAWIVLAAYGAKGLEGALSAALFFVLLFATVLLHEFGRHPRRAAFRRADTGGHLASARRRCPERIPEEPRQELLI